MKCRVSYKNIYILSVILLLSSCTEVELCSEGGHPHTMSVAADFQWGSYEREKPDSMYSFMSNVISGGNYAFTVLSSGGEINIPGGEYNFIACNKNDSLIEIAGMDTFVTNKSCPMKNLHLKIRETQYPDFGKYILKGWTDNNPAYKKLRNTGRIFMASRGIQVQQSTSSLFTFVPKPITQQITLNVKVKVSEGIVVDSILAELSGVVQKMNLTSGVLDESVTGRSYFPLYKQQGSDRETSAFEGMVHVLGILPGQVDMIYGSGMLNLQLYVGDRIVHRTMNLTSSLSQAELLREDMSAGGRIKNKDQAVIHVEMEYNQQEADGSDGSSVIWIDGDGDGSHIIEEET